MKNTTGRLVEMKRRIAAPPRTVFSFFIDPDLYRQWQGEEAELDPRPGGIFKVKMSGQTNVTAVGEFVEVDPPHRLVYTWGYEPGTAALGVHPEVPPGSSRVEVNLTPDGDG